MPKYLDFSAQLFSLLRCWDLLGPDLGLVAVASGWWLLLGWLCHVTRMEERWDAVERFHGYIGDCEVRA